MNFDTPLPGQFESTADGQTNHAGRTLRRIVICTFVQRSALARFTGAFLSSRSLEIRVILDFDTGSWSNFEQNISDIFETQI